MAVSAPTRSINIFFSYATTAPKDKRLFDKLTTHLSSLKRQQLIDEWYDSAVSVGSVIVQAIEAYLNKADIIVLLMSAEFFASERCYELEMKRALELSAAGNAHLIPVLLYPTDWSAFPLDQYEPLPADRNPISLWHNIDAALAEVARGIRRVVEELAQRTGTRRNATTTQLAPLYHVPYRFNALFTNRDDALTLLSSALTPTPQHQGQIAVLQGLGGMGKTQVALAYIQRSRHIYQHILWLSASSYAELSGEVYRLADELALSARDRSDEQHLFAAIKRWLTQHSHWLLVLDQIDEFPLLDLLLPIAPHGHVLLTTRTQTLSGLTSLTIPITPLDHDASALFLLRRARLLAPEAPLTQSSPQQREQAANIVQALDGFPLALDQAGAYLEETRCSLTVYLDLYHRERARLLSQRGSIRDSRHHADSVTTTLSLAFAQVIRKRAVQRELLHLLAFLQPDAIPDTLFVDGATVLPGALHALATQPLALYQALAELHDFSLLHHSSDRTTLHIHRIVQAVLTDALKPEQRRRWATRAVQLIATVFPSADFDHWPVCARYHPQARHCSDLIDTYQITHPDAPLLLERLASYCYRRASYQEAETYLQQALTLHELTHDTLAIARTLHAQALLYQRLARYQEAETLHLRALQLREEALGRDDPETADSLHNLAALASSLGHYQQALDYYQRILTIDEHTTGLDHPDAAATLNNLALTYYLLGNYPLAETTYQRALTVYTHSLSENDPEQAYTLSGLGLLAEQQGQYTQAEAFYQRALTLRQQALGDEHPDTAQSMNKLADLYESRNNDEQAEFLYTRALKISEQTLGPDHPDVALLLNNLAFLASKQARYQQAEPLYLRALSIYELALGEDHVLVASVLHNLAQLTRHNNIVRAETLMRRALAIRNQQLGPEHPDTAQSLNNLAEILVEQHRYPEARPLFEQALTLRLQTFGPHHHTVQHTQQHYDRLLEQIEHHEEKAQLQQEDHEELE